MKFLLGVGAADVELKNVQANLAGTDQWTLSGEGTAQVSVKGFTYKSKVSSTTTLAMFRQTAHRASMSMWTMWTWMDSD